MKRAIKSIKYRFATDMAEEIAILLVDHLKTSINALPSDSVMVPIPLHKKRYNWKGFNQAEELGKIIARKMKWKFVQDMLIRTRFTIPQVELKGDKRRSNVKGIFSFNNKYQLTSSSLKQVRSLIIFDDVITTGATVKEACKVIKRKNKDLNVWGLSVAR